MQFVKKVLPWLITSIALYITFKDVDWSLLLSHIKEADPLYVLVAVTLTILSYVLRSARWLKLFPDSPLSFGDSYRVLVLGFFFNNVLPARAGEFIRAHLGAQIAGTSRMTVLATIASERLVDGLMISLMFVLFASGLGDQGLSQKFFYVCLLFAVVGITTLGLLYNWNWMVSVATWLTNRFDSKHVHFTVNKIGLFFNGLKPLSSLLRLPSIIAWSAVIWSIELYVFYAAMHAYGSDLSLAHAVLLLVAVNFSSLIPAAPGGIGVIEAVGSAALVSVGVPKELALVMVMTQHVIQYFVVCVPGAFLTVTWRKRLEKLQAEAKE